MTVEEVRSVGVALADDAVTAVEQRLCTFLAGDGFGPFLGLALGLEHGDRRQGPLGLDGPAIPMTDHVLVLAHGSPRRLRAL